MASKIPRSDVLAAWIARQRWFASKTRRVTGLGIEDAIDLGAGTVTIVRLALADGSSERYAVPLGVGSTGAGDAEVADAFDDPAFCHVLLALIARSGRAPGGRGDLVGATTAAFPRALAEDPRAAGPPRRLGGEQSNTSVAFGDSLILKHFRRLADGVNPELEVTRFLTGRTSYRHTPRLHGSIEYRAHGGSPVTLAVLQELVAGARDGWQWALDELADFYRRVDEDERPEERRVAELGATSLAALRRLGVRTAELHLALASDPSDAAFAPEPITPDDLATWAREVRRQIAAAQRALGADHPLPAVTAGVAGLGGLAGRHKIRHHGDFHLGQTLYCPGPADFTIIDFEGEPVRPIPERRRKHSPLRDVAGMLRSIDYAAVTACPPAPPALGAWGEAWERRAAAEFVAGYRAAAGRAPFLPESDGAFTRSVATFELEKAAYEIVYEANHRPAWVEIPIRGFLRAAAAAARQQGAGAA